jgi:hypothetical protein
MEVFSEWLTRKLDQGLGLHAPRTAEGVYDQTCSPRWLYARVMLAAHPAPRFDFRSEAVWPDDKQIRYQQDAATDAERCEEAVLDGVLDELLAGESGDAITRVRLTLLEVECRKQSPPSAFYQAARSAIRRIVMDNVSRGE